MPLLGILGLLALLTLNACSCQRPITQTGIQSISFGSGGGFTGAVVSYSLSGDGQLSKTESGNTTPIKTIDAKRVSALFEKAADLKGYTFNEPDNIYSFVRIGMEGQEQLISWSPSTNTIDPRVTDLYGQLTALTE